VRTEESAVTFLTFSVLPIIKTRSYCENIKRTAKKKGIKLVIID